MTLGEHTTLYIQFDGEEIACGQIYRGRLVYWSCQDTYFRKYSCPRGLSIALVDLLVAAEIEEIDLIMPSDALRIDVATVRRTPTACERDEWQHFPHRDLWRRITRYDKPHYLEAEHTVKFTREGEVTW